MPNIDFYAAGADFLAVLTYVFDRSGCRVFESYSPLGEEIAEFKSIKDLSARYTIGVCRGSAPSALLQLVPPSGSNRFTIQRISLSPDVCHGHTFRYSVEGWGLVQLYIGGIGPHGLVNSHSNHNTEARARKWAETYRDLGPVELWNWRETTAVSSALNRFIRAKLTIYKLGSRPVLRDAAAAFAAGLDPVSVGDQNLLNERRLQSTSGELAAVQRGGA
jgi:hypothetical protein